MRLNSIKLSGFKSFVDPTTVTFPSSMSCIVGPNGCGKTTSIGMMLGLIEPSDGEIIINNKNLKNYNRDEILNKLNFCSPYIELPKKLTVKQNLEVYGRLYGVENLNERILTISDDLDIKKFFKV